jgi:beta-glucosidase
MRIDRTEISAGGQARVSFDVENVGKRAGVETSQLYLHEGFTPVSTPVEQLRGFRRVALNPGEKKTVTFTLTSQNWMLLDQDMHWVVAPGAFEIMMGRSSADIALKGIVEVSPRSGVP